ncbi:hypothetical protein HMPREF1548_05435 [Clostridium sp. KLE 1755]|nr:hypothetical protein HMPREF1548_05435 [Clostridium sp. KLE 1755]
MDYIEYPGHFQEGKLKIIKFYRPSCRFLFPRNKERVKATEE